MRGQFVHYIKHHIQQLYILLDDPTAIAPRVEYLLKPDRCMYPSNEYEVCSHPSPKQDFQLGLAMTWMRPVSSQVLAPEIANTIYGKYFYSKRNLGMLHPQFINRVNGKMA